MFCTKIQRFNGVLARVLILALVLAAWLSFPADAVGAEEEPELLQEIEEYLKNYYLYPLDEAAFPLTSLQDLESVLKDPYSFYLKEEQYRLFEDSLSRTLYGVGIYLESRGSSIYVVSTVPGSPAHRMGLESGDVVIAVEGRPVERLSLEEVVALIRGEEGEKVALTVRRGEAILNFTLVREKIRLPAVEYSWEGDGTALVRIYNFGGEAAREMEKVLEDMEAKGLRGLVLDLRGNQGGYLGEALEMASLFSGGVLLLVRDSSYADWQPISAPGESNRPYPIVILINGGTASAAEIFSAALKDNRKALLVGEVSFGKGTMQSIFELENGGYLKLTVAEFASPRGHGIEGMGVEPHFLVPGGEEQLLLALQLLRYRLQQEKGEGALWGALKKMQEAQGKTFPSVEVEGEQYLPLRAVLLLTGRAIQSGSEPWLYTFFWENRLYQLDTREGAITWKPAGKAGRLYCKVFISGGVTYVPRGFLEEELGLGAF